MAGLLAGLIQKGVSLAQTFITNARVGKQVLAAGGTVNTTTTGSGQTTTFTGGGAVQVPVWVWYVGGGFVLILVLWFLGKLFKIFK
jgi:hypothetical protein